MSSDLTDPKDRRSPQSPPPDGDPRIADILGAIAAVIAERGLERETLDAITARVEQRRAAGHAWQ